MANTFIKAEQVVAQMLGVLERDTVLAQFVWRDAVTDFRGAKNDTVSLKVPAYMTARTRVMRSSTQLQIDELDETKVDVSLDTHIYKGVRVTDEEMTLDISNFGEQVTAPAMSAVVRKVDDTIATELASASTATTVPLNSSDPYLGLVDARIALNNANVPFSQRFCVVGSNVESAILKSDRLSKFDLSGSSEALREAVIGRMAGFTIVSNNALDPDVAVAAHKTAFVLASATPVVPDGASWGTTQTWRGFALRVLRDYLPTDSDGPADRLLTDVFIGSGVVKDRGELDSDGKFQPTEDGGDDPILVRAVKLTLPGAS